MNGFTIFLIVVAIIILLIYAVVKYVMRESVIIGKIVEAVNSDNYDAEALYQIRHLLSTIKQMPGAINYNVSGDYTVMSQITYELEGATVEESKEIVNRIINDYNNN